MKAVKARRRKAILTDEFYRGRHGPLMSDGQWAGLKTCIPGPLSPDADARLRHAITDCCSWLFTEDARLKEGAGSAAALRAPGKGKPAPLDRLCKGLRMAAEAWKEVGGAFHDDRRTDIARFDNLESMAQDAERRVAHLRKQGTAQNITPTTWRDFVRKVADCLCREGFPPTATGRGYEAGANPTWFQIFMAALQADVLGKDGRPEKKPQAFAAEIAKALGGDVKRRKTRT